MSTSFHTKTIGWLALSSALLGAGLYVAGSGHRAMAEAKRAGDELARSNQALTKAQQYTQAYAQLIQRIGWRPGQDLRHEAIDTTAIIADHESDRLNEILRANHVGKGQFFLRSLQIEAIRAGQTPRAAVKVTVKGDNILVLDRP